MTDNTSSYREFPSGAREWDGTPGKSEDEFWQSIQDLAYMLTDDPIEPRRDRINYFLQNFPDLSADTDADFRRYAVHSVLVLLAEMINDAAPVIP
jgi:hypothetical protein